MPERVVDRALALLVGQSAQKSLTITFFGGEPLLAPLAWYEHVTAELRRYSERSFALGLTTNGTILTPAHVDFFEREGVGLCVSLDGPPLLNDRLRAKGRRVLENIRRLHRAGISTAVIALISPYTWHRTNEIIAFFESEEIRKVRFNTCFAAGRGARLHMLSADELFEAKRSILEHMIATRGNRLVERNVAEQVLWFAGAADGPDHERRRGCGAYTCHAGHAYLSVSPEGGLYPCSDVTFTREDLRLGSVFDEWDPAQTSRMESVRDSFLHKGSWWADCATCAAAKICDFGCPAFVPQGWPNTNLECAAVRLMWEYMCSRGDDVRQLATRLRRREDRGRAGCLADEGAAEDGHKDALGPGEFPDCSLADGARGAIESARQPGRERRG